MDLFVLLLLNGIALVFMQTCHEIQVQEITHVSKHPKHRTISCLIDLSLEHCALECLLVTKCTSINHVINTQAKSSMCELLDDGIDNGALRDVYGGYSYVNIQDWQQDVASTCASRPCADNQRCIPTNPYRCIDIVCGIPSVLPVHNKDTNMTIRSKTTTIGSRAYYQCRDPSRIVAAGSAFGHLCNNRVDRICNSDSSWTTQEINCRE